MSLRRREFVIPASFVTEEEVYREHRWALDATLFRGAAAPEVTFELDSGSLSLVSRKPEGDQPRD